MQRQKPGQPRPENLRPDPAPGDLRLLQSFINMRDAEENLEEFDSPEALGAWLAGQGLMEPDVPISELEWHSARIVREGLRTLLWAHNGADVREKSIDLMNRILERARPHLRFEYDDSVKLKSEDTGWHGALTRILEIILNAMREGSWERLKACQNGRCGWIFFDGSKNRSAKWCTVRRCGNRINAETYRRRNPKIPLPAREDEAALLKHWDNMLRELKERGQDTAE